MEYGAVDGPEDIARPDSSQLARVAVAASGLATRALHPFLDRDWRSLGAGDLDWSVWDTLVHVNDDLYFYAAQVLLADERDYVCFELAADDHTTPGRLVAALPVNARLLAAAVAAADPGVRAHHVHGASDPGGFAAMGAVEVLVHTYDAVCGLDGTSDWRPPDDLARPVLDRLFPHVPTEGTDRPGDLLLYACGRIALADRPRLADWRWYGAVPGDDVAAAQLAALGWLDEQLRRAGVDYWVFGGWAVDLHAGRVTRAHSDVDVAIWRHDLPEVHALLAGAGWTHTPDPDEDGWTAYSREEVRLELAVLARADDGTVFTPASAGPGAWPEGSFGADVAGWGALRARVVGRASLVEDKSSARSDAVAAGKDRADVAVLSSRSADATAVHVLPR